MTKIFALILIALVSLTTASAGYTRPQTNPKERSRTGRTAKPSSTNRETTQAKIASTDHQSNAKVSLQSVGGSGFQGTIPIWITSTSLGNSTLRYDASDHLSINGSAYPNTEVTINAGPDNGLRVVSSGIDGIYVKGSGTNGLFSEGNSFGVVGIGNTGVSGGGSQGPGVYGHSGGSYGVHGHSDKSYGVFATGDGFAAILGQGTSNTGVLGSSDSAKGVWGSSTNGVGVQGVSPNGYGAKFFGKVAIVASGSNPGDLSVEGMLSKGGGSFKIDHPLDPENKYLYHSFVESPDMMNIYNGNIVTNENGEAVVTMPEYFEALNAQFRYQLTVIGTFAQAIVAEKIRGNRFVIKTNAPNVEVSWQVTGVRNDAFAKKNRVKVEVEKEESERGLYLHPGAFNQSVERGIEWARNSESMLQTKARQ